MTKEKIALKRLYDKADYSRSRHSADEDFEVVDKAIDVLNLFKDALTLETKSLCYTPITEVHDDGSISVAMKQEFDFIKHGLNKEYKKVLTQWVIENIDKETVRKWLEE